MRKNEGMNERAPSAPANRYAAPHEWQAVDRYFAEILVEEDAALIAARRSGTDTTMPNAEVAANQGAFLGLLVTIAGAKRVLEFGTLAGYSTIWLARAVGEGGHVVTLELEPQNAEVAEENFLAAGVADRIETIVGPAVETSARLMRDSVEPFDFVFIDADKPNNPAYLQAALELTQPGAVIVVDNVVRNGAVVDESSTDPRAHGVRSVADAIADNPDLEATALQTVGEKGWDGLIIARRR